MLDGQLSDGFLFLVLERYLATSKGNLVNIPEPECGYLSMDIARCLYSFFGKQGVKALFVREIGIK